MSGKSGKGNSSKQEKKEIKEFKKVFKKQTGIESDSKSWGKLVAAVVTQARELRKWTAILVKNQPDERESAEQRVQHWSGLAEKLVGDAKQDEKAAGLRARDQLLPVLLKVLEAVRKKAKSKPIKQDVDGREVSVFLTDIPGFFEMATNEREAAVKKAAKKTALGMHIYEQVSAGTIDLDDPNYTTPPEQAEALIWAMKSKAQEKNGGPYQKGAMTVPNGEKLRKFLDKCPEVYSRLSSHLREQQGRNKSGGIEVTDTEGQTPRGMDFYDPESDKKPGSLPAGMNALLYQQVVLPNGEVALYLKMETEGSFGHPGDNRKMDSTVPPDRPKHGNDNARARKHLRNLIIKQTEAEDKDLSGLREQTPKPIVEAIKAVVSAVEGKKAKAYLKTSYGTEPKLLLFKKAVPRISLFLSGVDDCYKHAGEQGWELGDAAEDLLGKLNGVLISSIPAELLEPDRRMGGEVVLTDSDMTTVEDTQDDDIDDEAGDDDDTLDKSEVMQRCSELVDAVVDKDLQQELQKIYYGDVLTNGDSDAFQRFSSAVGKSETDKLGPRAGKIFDRITRELERL